MSGESYVANIKQLYCVPNFIVLIFKSLEKDVLDIQNK